MKQKIEGNKNKHLLPQDLFRYPERNPKSGKTVDPVSLLYHKIDLVFNHKNVWANMQHYDPAHIYYNLHDDAQWLPLIRDVKIPHCKGDEADYKQYSDWLAYQRK